ncbi:MAG TPA: TIGR02757 family protein [Cyclobacteriaceae bacterium]
MNDDLKSFLDQKVEAYNCPHFIAGDPICIPHEYKKKEDIEITAFWTATLAWGQRKTIINKSRELFSMMDNSPHEFILNHHDNDLKPFLNFKHRTFNATDTLYFIKSLNNLYLNHGGLEEAFRANKDEATVAKGLCNFHNLFFGLNEYPKRTEKHVATPVRNSACKRLNMFLRWMVRSDDKGVDFGIWDGIKPRQLICPCDLHVDRISRKLGLVSRKQTDWLTALELTENLRFFDKNDPVKYDFALYGLGVMEKF